MTWLESCEHIECHPNYQKPPRKGPPLGTYVVLHYTAPPLWTAQIWARQLKEPHRERKWSCHVLVDREGQAVQCVPLDKEASHAGDGRILDGKVRRSANIGSWGIEVVNAGWATSQVPLEELLHTKHRNPADRKSKNWHLYTPEQYKTLATVLSEMAMHRADPNKPLYVLGHEDVTNKQAAPVDGAKLDPGPAFDWDALLSLLVDDPIERLMWDFDRKALVRYHAPMTVTPQEEPTA